MSRLVYFGSAFNPPTYNHMRCMQWLLALPEVTHLLAGPSKAHAFAKNMADYNARCEMLQDMLAATRMPQAVQVCRIEEELAKEGQPVYTYDVLVALKERYPTQRIVFGMGQDNLDNFCRFYKHQDILNEFEVETCPSMGPFRATDIRNAAQQGNAQFIQEQTSPVLLERIFQLYK